MSEEAFVESLVIEFVLALTMLLPVYEFPFIIAAIVPSLDSLAIR
jgi:hypothetical protein